MVTSRRKPSAGCASARESIDGASGYEDAKAELSAGLNFAQTQGFRYEEVLAMRALAELAWRHGRDEEARDVLHEAERLMQHVVG
jgi:hypothetical protein